MEMCQWNWVIGVYRLGEHVTMLQTDQSVLHSANGQLPKANGKSKRQKQTKSFSKQRKAKKSVTWSEPSRAAFQL